MIPRNDSRLRRKELAASLGHEEVERQLDADAFLLRFLVDEPRGRGELNTHARVVLEQRDFLVVFAAAAFTGQKLAQLVQVFELYQAALDTVVEFRLLKLEDLH